MALSIYRNIPHVWLSRIPPVANSDWVRILKVTQLFQIPGGRISGEVEAGGEEAGGKAPSQGWQALPPDPTTQSI